MSNDEEVALAIELLDSGVPRARVVELFEGRINPTVLESIVDTKNDRTRRTSRDHDVDPNIRRLVDEMRAPEQFLDPLYKHLMRDPVALSSGHIFDRSSVVDSKGSLKFRICPISSKHLDGTFFSLSPKKREIERFKATRDRNVTEISRKMIASGEYDSFHLVLEGVENYIRSLGENYLPLARELAAMWSGIREAPTVMLLAENVDSKSLSRSQETIVSSGGLQDKVFRIIVSAEYFRDQSYRRDEKSGLYLSLFNDHGLLVERAKLFDDRKERNASHHEIFGKHDRIVTKSKPGFSYKLECMSSNSGRSLDVQGLMCKIFPESSKRSSYRMEDAEGDKGIYMGSVDIKNIAQGQGFLDYDDGRRFIGKFHHGSMYDGVLYRGAHVVSTMRGGVWTDEVNETLVQEYNVNMLVYDVADAPRSERQHEQLYNSYHKKSSNRARDREMPFHKNEYDPYSQRRSGRIDIDATSHRSHVTGKDSDRYEDNLSRFLGNIRVADDLIDDAYSCRSSYRKSNANPSDRRPRGHELPARYNDDDDFFGRKKNSEIDRSRGYELPALRGKSKYIEDVEYDRETLGRELPALRGKSKYIEDVDDEETHGHELPALRGKSKFIDEVDYGRERQQSYRLGSRSMESVDRRRGLFDDKFDLDITIRPSDEKTSRSYEPPLTVMDGISPPVDNFRSLSRPRSRGKKVPSGLRGGLHVQRSHNEEISVLSDSWNGYAREMSKKDEDLRNFDSMPRGNSERNDDDEDEAMSILRKLNNRDGRMGTLYEGNRDDTRDVVNNTTRSVATSEKAMRPMILMVDGVVQNVRGPNNKLLLKGGILQDSVRCIYATGEKFADVEGMSRILLTLRDESKNVVEQVDLFGKSTNKNYSPHRLMDENDPIVSEARPGYFYQLECEVSSGHQDTVTLAGLLCKIIPSSLSAPVMIEMTDPEGAKGWYTGPLNINNKATGKGSFHYFSGHTFIGEFNNGSWRRGAYYRGIVAAGSMKDGKWDPPEKLDMKLVGKFPIKAHYFANRKTRKTEVLDKMESNSYSGFGVCCGPV